MRYVRERRHRLPEEYYLGPRVVAFTACLTTPVTGPSRSTLFRIIEETLRDSTAAHHCILPVYLLMPDHIHLLMSSHHETGNLLAAMRLFKQRSGYALVRTLPEVVWQKGYYDHILRHDEEAQKHLKYILNNPVRAGLVRHPDAWPWRGSTEYDLASLPW